MNNQGIGAFTPSRLVLARDRVGMTQKRLGELAGVSPRTIKAYEAGEATPSKPTLDAVCQALGFAEEFFTAQPIDILPLEAASFRALSKASAVVRNRAVASGTFAVELLHPFLSERFELPKPDVPDQREQTPAGAAAALRHVWSLGQRPIKQMIHLLELHGVRVFSLSEDCQAIDAFSLWRDGVPFIFLNTRKSAERSIFDAAHELGHLTLHRHGVPQGHDAENEADHFASHFLLPEAAVRSDAPLGSNVAAVASMKRRWHVSTAALGRRLHDLGLMTDYNYTRFNKELSHRGRHIEPSPLPRETSAILQKTLTALAEEGLDTRAIARELCLPLAEIRALTFGLSVVSGSRVGPAASQGNLRLVQ